MGATATKETFTEERIRCPHCGAYVRLKVKSAVRVTTEEEIYYDHGHPQLGHQSGEDFEVCQCSACDQSVVLAQDWFEPDGGYVRPYEPKVVYPRPDDGVPSGLPKEIGETYKTALKLRPIDPDSFGNKGRYLLEQICIEQGAEGKFLVDLVKSLADKKLIPDRLAEVASRIRELGNFATHPTKGGVNKLEAETIWKLVRAIVAYVYELPELLREADAGKDKLEQQEKALEAKRVARKADPTQGTSPTKAMP